MVRRQGDKKRIFMFGVIHMDGTGDDNPPVESLSSLYDELFTSGIDDGNVAVINDDSGWCMSAYRDGRIVFGNLKDPQIQNSDCHMIPVPKERVLELWKRLIDGDIDPILQEPWKPGYDERYRPE